MAVEIKSLNQILGEMVRKLVADSPLNDVNIGSVIYTLLEAAAESDFENNASILSVLELLNIDAVRNNDLDNRGADFGLTRVTAQRSSGFVTISDSNITKISTGLYQVKPAPIAGSTQIFVNDASDFAASGTLFIGRGTNNFEGPISYSSIVDNGSFYTINLDSALQKDHLISEIVTDSQGTTDRLITAGSVVEIPANNQNPAIQFRILRDAVIPSGEDTIENVAIVSVLAGSQTNAGINTIISFVSPPFTGITVTNTTPTTGGRDTETDAQFRERIKSYANTLARGTEQAILSAVIGVSDSDDGKQVASAVITEPPEIGDPSILYIDDGSGFQPTIIGQSVDTLLRNATGSEEFLQLANYPLPRPQAINTVDGPFEITEGMELRVLVDGIEESVFFTASQFSNIAAATLAEIIVAVNDQSETFKITFTDNSTRLLIYPVAFDAETIQVAPLRSDDTESLIANSVLKFPTDVFSYITLYKNNTLLSEKARAASLLSSTFSNWNILISGNLIISVDGTPPQDASFTVSDFDGAPFATLSLENWANAFNNKFAGITATATSSGRLQITSNKIGSASQLEIIGGTYFDQMFNGQNTSDTGINSDFELNRQNGNIRILTDIAIGDTISAGSADTKGRTVSAETVTGNYNVSTDTNSRPAEIIVVADADAVVPRTNLSIITGNVITVTDEGSSTMRLMADTVAAFQSLLPGDYIYITSRGGASSWIDPANTGLYRIAAKGEHTTAGTDTYIEVKNDSIVPGVHVVEAGEDIQAFSSDAYPQLWKGTFTTSPASAPIQDVVDSFNNNLVNTETSIFKTSSIKLTSSTENGGSIATPVSIGNAALLFPSELGSQEGNQSQIAARVASSDLISFFKRTAPQSEDVYGTPDRDVWLNRVVFTDVRGALTANAAPGEEGVDTYSEEIESTGVLTTANVAYDDALNFTEGSNKRHYRSVRDLVVGDRVGTQHELPRTLIDHVAGEEFNLMRYSALSPNDSIVFILDQDSVNKTIDVRMSRTGQINNTFPPTDISFSANDFDNEPGITFSSLQVWGKDTNNTEFQDYGVWFQARNWYVSGGAGSGGGSFILRADEYGPHGENIRFNIEYPQLANQTNIITHANNADYSLVTYFFGSDAERPIGESAGTELKVTSLGSDIYRYTFQSFVDLSAVVPGDVVSMRDDSGISATNRGVFSIRAVDDVAKSFDVYNPNGTITLVGNPEVTEINTIADVIGSATVTSVTGITNNFGSVLDGTYFIINDAAGSVAVYYNSGTPNPGAGALGVDRVIEVLITPGDADTLVTTLTAAAIDADSEFTTFSGGTSVTITNVDNGAFLVGVDSGTPTGFTFGGTLGTPDISLDGLYFTLQDAAGSVAFWYDVTGATPEPLHGADRSVEITTVNAGDNADTVATKTAVVIAGDPAFASATTLTNTITVTDLENGARPAASAGTSGFTVTENTPGIDDGVETIILESSFSIFPLLFTDLASITEKISESDLVNATVLDDTNPIIYATREEVYTPTGPSDYSASLSHEHDPDPLNNLHNFIKLFDGISYVKDFDNTNPNFTLKTPLVLQGSAPTAYSMESAPAFDGSTGEFFKLVPITLNNMLHQFTQKALSQLPIVSDVDISNQIRRIQIKSKELGSAGAVEVVGGNANNVSFAIFGEGQTVTGPESGDSFLQVRTRSFPVTLTEGDYVRVENTLSARRVSRLTGDDTIDVVAISASNFEYRWAGKETNFDEFVRFTISDVSTTYGRPAGTMWRWTHNDGGSSFRITDTNIGTVGLPPEDTIEDGLSDAPALEINLIDAGTISTAQQFELTVSALPNQADYFTFESQAGVTFAVWFDIDGAGTAPTGATYLAATNKIEIDISSGDTENQVVSALATTLLANGAFIAEFSGLQLQGATFANAAVGDLLTPIGMPATWDNGNVSKQTGDGRQGGHVILAVNAASRYVDVHNPEGTAMTDIAIGSGAISLNPTPSIEWKLPHYAKPTIAQAINAAGTVTVSMLNEHKLNAGDTFTIDDNGLAQTTTVDSVTGPLTFVFTDTTAAVDGTYLGGNILKSGKTVTRYKIESLGFSDLYRLKYVDGEAPLFVDNGVAVDDIMVISGSTFNSLNSGAFRVLGVDDTSILFENASAIEQLNTIVSFNNLDTSVTWTSNLDEVVGTVGSFKNVAVGDWVKKFEDTEERYVQVVDLLDSGNSPVAANLATKLKLGQNYTGATATTRGVKLDQNSGIGTGLYLDSMDDIRFFEGDSVRIGDNLFVDNISNVNWFAPNNSGTFGILEFGTNGIDGAPFVRIENLNGITETGRDIGVSEQGFFILEGAENLYKSIRVVEHSVIDSFNSDRRLLYLTPATKVDRMSQSNGTTISPIGKLNYPSDVTSGIDGYSYYAGLLRTVQRIIDGYEPESSTYPGRRAVGGQIEILPPLIKRITINLDVTTNEGVNLNEINNDIKTAVIDYIDNLGVGEDVILSEITVGVMNITGVAAVTFTSPAPSTERISIADNEKGFIEPDDISVA